VAIVVKKEFQNDIVLDGKKLTTWNTYWDYSIAWSTVTHEQHLIQVVSGSAAKFAAYVYGHSILDYSSGGYGYTVGYKGRSLLAV